MSVFFSMTEKASLILTYFLSSSSTPPPTGSSFAAPPTPSSASFAPTPPLCYPPTSQSPLLTGFWLFHKCGHAPDICLGTVLLLRLTSSCSMASATSYSSFSLSPFLSKSKIHVLSMSIIRIQRVQKECSASTRCSLLSSYHLPNISTQSPALVVLTWYNLLSIMWIKLGTSWLASISI